LSAPRRGVCFGARSNGRGDHPRAARSASLAGATALNRQVPLTVKVGRQTPYPAPHCPLAHDNTFSHRFRMPFRFRASVGMGLLLGVLTMTATTVSAETPAAPSPAAQPTATPSANPVTAPAAPRLPAQHPQQSRFRRWCAIRWTPVGPDTPRRVGRQSVPSWPASS
jgi:hypothetical protein